ncbi:MAG: porin [Candidatus Firestonebacteria bacterium]
MNKVIYMLIVIVGLFLSISVNAAEEAIAVKVGEGSLTVSGYVHTRYSYTSYDNPDAFAVVRARLILSGSVVPDVSYRFQYDLRLATSGLRDAFIKYSNLPLGMAITVGQFKIPISEAGIIWGTAANNLINGPIIYEGYLYKKTGYSTITFADRETGIVLDGKMLDNTIGYALGVVNGNGINIADDNNNKDILARVTVAPFKELNLGVGAMSGREVSATYIARKRLIATAKCEIDSFKLVSEYFYQEREKSVGKLATDNFYITGSYIFKLDEQFIEPVLRYQQYTADVFNADYKVNVVTPGLNFGLNKYTRLQVNYNYIQDEIAANDNEVLVQLELKF